MTLLAGCGGGGNSGGAGTTGSSGTTGSGGTLSLLLSTTSVTQHATITQASAAMASVNLTVANRPAGALYLGYAYSTNGVASINFSDPTNPPPSLVITFRPPYGLKPGTYTDSLQMELCADSECAQPLTARQAVAISYVVTAATGASAPAMMLSTSSVSAQVFLTSSPNTFPQAPSVSVSFRNVPVDPQVSPTTTQAGVESVSYVGTSQALAGSLTIYLRSPLATGAGVFHDTITVNACLDQACNNPITPVTLAVTYTVTNTVSGANGYTIAVYPIVATDMIWDGVNSHLLVSTPGNAPSNPSVIAILDPATGELSAPTAVPGVPRIMAIAADSSYLYVGLDTPSAIQRFVLPGMTPDIQIPLPTGYLGVATNAKTIEVAPDNPRTISVTLQDASGNPNGLVIFDDATARADTFGNPGVMPLKYIDSAEWGATGSVLFGSSNDIVGGSGDLYGFNVSTAGVQLQNDVPGSPSGRGHFAQNLLYLDGGAIVDPATLSVTGTFTAPLANLLVAPDATAGRAFFVNTAAATSTFTGVQLESFDLATQAPIATVPLPYANPLSYRLIRWGTSGLGFVDIYHGNIVVVSGSFVAP